MITTVQCSICSQLNNKPRVVVIDFSLHHTCSIIEASLSEPHTYRAVQNPPDTVYRVLNARVKRMRYCEFLPHAQSFYAH